MSQLQLPLSDYVPFVEFAAVVGIHDGDEGVAVADIASPVLLCCCLRVAIVIAIVRSCSGYCCCRCYGVLIAIAMSDRVLVVVVAVVF